MYRGGGVQYMDLQVGANLTAEDDLSPVTLLCRSQ